MSASLLYHGFGIRGYQYVKTEYEAGQVVFTICQDRGALRCAVRGSRRVVRRGFQPRRFRSLPIGTRGVQVLLELNVPSYRAKEAKRREDSDQADTEAGPLQGAPLAEEIIVAEWKL